MISLKLPLPPSVNALYYNKKSGGRGLTTPYRKWKVQADYWYLIQKQSVKPVTGRCQIIIRLPEGMRGDASNRIKAAEDYLVSREITSDDKHNREVTAKFDKGVEKNFCIIQI